MLSGRTWVPLLLATLMLAPFTQGTQKAGRTQKRGGSSAQGSRALAKPVEASVAKPFHASGCDDSLWEHVYHPQRLKNIDSCIEVTGTIHHQKREADGDDHIQLALDSQYAALLNDGNAKHQADCLVLEPICQYPVTQADAVEACRDFHSDVEVPAKGTHVRVKGTYVWDSEAGHGWMEIHPVTSIEVIP